VFHFVNKQGTEFRREEWKSVHSIRWTKEKQKGLEFKSTRPAGQKKKSVKNKAL
jgi:hypothetical protein